MKGLNYSSEQAKRLILEAPDNTRRTFITMLVVTGILAVLLVLSWFASGNSWTCELDNTDVKHAYVCKELRAATSCRSISGPIRAEIMLDINSEVKASALVVCPFENAISEIRICYVLASIMSVLIGMMALSSESRKRADMHINSAYFLCALLAIAATFDLFSIWDSEVNNENLCTLTEEFEMEEGVTNEKLACGYTFYYLTAYIGYFAAFAMAVSAHQISKWKSTLTLDGL